jgi:hypothetical protein
VIHNDLLTANNRIRQGMNKSIFLLALVTITCSACTVSEVVTAEKTELDVASLNISENLLLDVGIVRFDPGVPANNNSDKTGVYEGLREAEARYLPYHIKTTLQSTGYWGAVRVLPSENVFSDVLLSGLIERSDGEYITLKVKAVDLTGREWFERTYAMQTGSRSYAMNRDRSEDPYQKVFNDLANDLHMYAESLTAKQIGEIRQTSELLFFADMAPTVFGEHLVTDDDGMLTTVRLPAENDPMVARLRQIRERDRLVVDTLNEHYANFYYGIAIPYEGWRKKARESAIDIRQTKRSATMRALLGIAVTAGAMSMNTGSSSRSGQYSRRAIQSVGIDRGIRTIYSAFQLRRSVSIYRDEIGELSESFIAEATPLTVRVEGETRRLTGTAEAQYESWRKLIKDIYQLETGFSEVVDVGVPARTAQPTG